MNWMPIDTAPKDGRWVLVSGGLIRYGWDAGDDRPSAVAAQFVSGMNCWQFAWFDGGHYGEYENPTQWMPIPEADK